MKLRYMKEVAFEELLDNIDKIVDKYQSEVPFLFDYFEGKIYYNESNIIYNELKMNPNDGDFSCAVELYEKLSDLTPSQASSPYLWTYLCHNDAWDYMKQRWPINKDDKTDRLKSRYFGTDKNNRREILRNGLSRLWWGVYLSIDERPGVDKYKYTKILFTEEDLYTSLMERDYSMCKEVTMGLLSYFYDYREEHGKNPPVDVRRELMKYINRVGGLTTLDLMTREEIRQLCVDYMTNN